MKQLSDLKIINEGSSAVVYDAGDEIHVIKVLKNPTLFMKESTRYEAQRCAAWHERHEIPLEIQNLLPGAALITDGDEIVGLKMTRMHGQAMSKAMYESLTEEQKENLAQTLARFLVAFHSMSGKPPETAQYGKRFDHVDSLVSLLKQNPEGQELCDRFQVTQKEVDSLSQRNIPVLPIHKDIRFPNLLMDHSALSGVLDVGDSRGGGDLLLEFAKSLQGHNSGTHEFSKRLFEAYAQQSDVITKYGLTFRDVEIRCVLLQGLQILERQAKMEAATYGEGQVQKQTPHPIAAKNALNI